VVPTDEIPQSAVTTYAEAVAALDGSPEADAAVREYAGSNSMDTIGYAQEMEDAIAVLVALAMQSARPGLMAPVLDLLPILLLPNGAFDVTPILALLSRVFPSYAPAVLRRALLKTSRDILAGSAQHRPLASVTNAEARERAARLAVGAPEEEAKEDTSEDADADADEAGSQRRLPAKKGLPQFLLGIS